MLWIKAFHIIFVTSWFAGLFYLPRLFVNHAMVTDVATLERLSMMEKKLYRFMLPLAILAIFFGVWVMISSGMKGGWLHAKLLLVVFLIIYHGFCGKLMADFSKNRNKHSHIWYRWFNEIPVILLVAIVILVTVKPF